MPGGQLFGCNDLMATTRQIMPLFVRIDVDHGLKFASETQGGDERDRLRAASPENRFLPGLLLKPGMPCLSLFA